MNIKKDTLFGDIRDHINLNDTQPSISDMIAMLRIEVSELKKELKLGEQKVEPIGWYWEELTSDGWVQVVDTERPDPHPNRQNIRPLTFLTSIY